MIKFNNKGQSLIEVMVAATVMSMASVVILQVASMAMANNRLSKERIVGVRLAQEGWEWLKRQQGDDWGAFKNQVDTNYAASHLDYCLADAFNNALSSINTVCAPGTYGLRMGKADYQRNIRLTTGTDPSGDYVQAVITVEWVSRNKKQVVKVEGTLRPQ